MIQPIKYFDDPLLKDIPESATKFEFANVIIAILHREKKEFDLLIINKDTPGIYYHMFQEKGEIYFKKTYRLKNGEKKYEYIDLEKFTKKLSIILSEFFSKAEKIEINDERFVGKFVYFIVNHTIHLQEKTKKRVIFGQDYDMEKILFENIDKTFNKLGFTFDKDDKEKDMIFVNYGNIFCIDIKYLDELDNSNSDYFKNVS